MRRPISSAAHGLLDYPAGLLLIVSPWLFGFGFFRDDALAASAIPFLLGVMIIGQSLITDYEFSVLNLLPLKAHLAMDVLGGALLAVSPFLFGFTSQPGTETESTWVFHVVAGLGLIASGLLTRTERAASPAETRQTVEPASPEFVDDPAMPRNGRFQRDDSTSTAPARGGSAGRTHEPGH